MQNILKLTFSRLKMITSKKAVMPIEDPNSPIKFFLYASNILNLFCSRAGLLTNTYFLADTFGQILLSQKFYTCESLTKMIILDGIYFEFRRILFKL